MFLSLVIPTGLGPSKEGLKRHTTHSSARLEMATGPDVNSVQTAGRPTSSGILTTRKFTKLTTHTTRQYYHPHLFIS